MKCTIPEISWHNRDPVLSVDIQPKPLLANNKNGKTRLASGGSDSHVLVWFMELNEQGTVKLDLAADLNRHQRAVNVVRWSPSGEMLASGDDESIIFIWTLKNEKEPMNILDDNNEEDKEVWLIYKTLRGHLEDVYDLSWSPSSLFLLSGSVDNAAIVWDIKRGRHKAILNDHSGFVQGVAWDPKNKYLATLATDRYFRLFNAETNKICRRVNKSTLPVPESSVYFNQKVRLFHDDTLQTFYRRFCFTPDGELIIVPSGIAEIVGANNNENKPLNTTYIFSRYSTARPAVVIPSPDQYTIAVRCCPLLFELRLHDESVPPVINLPYRMIFAIATKSSVYLYDTQQEVPFALISNIHYARLTDLTWSTDGNVLIVSSVDGFCTLVTFEEGELGTIYKKPVVVDKENEDIANEKPSENTENTSNDKNDQAITEKEAEKNNISIETNKNQIETPKEIKTELMKKEPTTVLLNLPETIIATAERFESPEYEKKPATPIAIRREPRRTPSSDSTRKPETHSPDRITPKAKDSKKATPIAVRRKPRNILPSPVVIDKSAPDHQDEALDAWPIPIEQTKELKIHATKRTEKDGKFHESDNTKTEDMCLVYEGDTESETIPQSKNLVNPSNNQSDDDHLKHTDTTNKVTENAAEQNSANDAKCPKTPRRVQLRTISTPKSKKNLP